ncbi:MAG: hypothetical protein K0R90_294 [Oscillospiraceae bacterium]|nr:hypothetical protein [Oscillospiraceae bacterium]
MPNSVENLWGEHMKEILFYEDYRDKLNCPTCFFEKNNDNVPHFHSAVEIMYITKGYLYTTVSGKHFKLEQGDLLVVPSSEIHMFRSDSPVEDIVLMIPINYIPTFEKLFSVKTFSDYILTGKTARDIYGFIKEIEKNKSNPKSPIVRGYTYLILGYLSQNIEMKDKQINDNHLIHSIVKYIEHNYASPITIGMLAEKFKYTESQLSRFFNEMMGCSFPDYLGKLRTKKAAFLLTYENYTVIDAAMESGFESLRTFYRVFKKNYSITPLQYKKSTSSDIKKNG